MSNKADLKSRSLATINPTGFHYVWTGWSDGISCDPIPSTYDSWSRACQINYEQGRHLAAYCRAMRFYPKWPKHIRLPDWIGPYINWLFGKAPFNPPKPPSLGDL